MRLSRLPRKEKKTEKLWVADVPRNKVQPTNSPPFPPKKTRTNANTVRKKPQSKSTRVVDEGVERLVTPKSAFAVVFLLFLEQENENNPEEQKKKRKKKRKNRHEKNPTLKNATRKRSHNTATHQPQQHERNRSPRYLITLPTELESGKPADSQREPRHVDPEGAAPNCPRGYQQVRLASS